MFNKAVRCCLRQIDIMVFGICLSSLVTFFDIWSAMQMLWGRGEKVIKKKWFSLLNKLALSLVYYNSYY